MTRVERWKIMSMISGACAYCDRYDNRYAVLDYNFNIEGKESFIARELETDTIYEFFVDDIDLSLDSFYKMTRIEPRDDLEAWLREGESLAESG